MKLFVNYIEFGIIEVLVSNDGNIKEIKESIHGKIGLNVNLLNLFYNGEILEDNKTLDKYEIINNSVINVVNKLRGGMRVFVENNEKIFAFEIEQNEKIINTKLQIFKSLKIDDKYFHLVYNDKIFDGDETLIEFGLQNNSLINIVKGYGMHIFAETMDGKTFPFEVHKLDKIIDVKHKIQELIGLHPNLQQFVYQNEILEDDNMIDDYLISDQSVINIVDRLKNEMQIFANTTDGQTIIIKTSKSHRIINLKGKIQEQIGLHPNEQIVRYQDKILDDHKMLDKYKIVENSVINVDARFREGIQLFAKTMDGQSNIIKVVCIDKIIDLKHKIQELIGLHPDEQKLIYQDEILDDDRTIDEYGICEKSVINVIRRLRGEMKIFAETTNGHTITFEVEKSEKIIDIKKKIQEKTGLRLDEQILKYYEEILDDDKMIDEYGICEKSVINIVEELREIQIKFQRINETIVSINVRKSYKIRNIKNKIRKQIKLNRKDKFIYNGVILDNNKTIDEYQISDQSLINIINKSKIEILINLEIFDGRKFKLCAEKQTKIIDIKKQIEFLFHFYPIKQNLYYQNVLLEGNEDTLEEIQALINIRHVSLKRSFTKRSFKCELTISLELSNDWLEIFVEIANKTQYKLFVFKLESIRDVKNKIHQIVNVEPNEQILFYKNSVLENNKTVKESNIYDKAVLLVEFNIKTFIKSMKSKSIEEVQMCYEKVFLEMKYGSYLRHPIHYACKYGRIDIVEYLIKEGCNLEVIDSENRRPIHYVCAAENVGLLNIILQQNISVEASDFLDRRPIHIACFNGNIDIVKILIENKCDKEACDYKNRRPIHYACINGEVKIIEFLIENNCDIESLDKSNRSPLMIAEENNSEMLIEILKKELEIRRNIRKVADAMNLKCFGENCDHTFCYTSMLHKNWKGKEIYRGDYGKVYKCKESANSRYFAYKKLKDTLSCNYIEANINDFIEDIKHERIIEYFGGFEIEPTKFIFMEYLEAGSLQVKIQKTNIPLKEIICFTKQILEALEFLHGKQIIHRDIKPDNILFDKANIKLIDFGFSLPLSKVGNKNPQNLVYCGTLNYMAPEITIKKTYSCSVDIWSLGITVIEMATGRKPHRKFDSNVFIDNETNTRTIEYQLPDTLPHSNNLKSFINEMLNSDGSSRPSATELLSKLNAYFLNYLSV